MNPRILPGGESTSDTTSEKTTSEKLVYSMTNKVVLITGCSVGGIGYSICEHFAHKGCRVYATARHPERMQGLDKLGCILRKLDVTDTEGIRNLLSEIIRKEGRIDILVNNAGGAMRGAVIDCPEEKANTLFEANYWGVVSMTRVVAPHMIKQRHGTIINIGSLQGVDSL